MHSLALHRNDKSARISCQAQRSSDEKLRDRDADNATESSSGSQKQNRGIGLGDLLGPIGLTIGGGPSPV